MENSGSHDLIMTYNADSDGEGEFGKSTHQILNIGSYGSKMWDSKTTYFLIRLCIPFRYFRIGIYFVKIGPDHLLLIINVICFCF